MERLLRWDTVPLGSQKKVAVQELIAAAWRNQKGRVVVVVAAAVVVEVPIPWWEEGAVADTRLIEKLHYSVVTRIANAAHDSSFLVLLLQLLLPTIRSWRTMRPPP